MSILAFTTALGVTALMAMLGLSVCSESSPPLGGPGPAAVGEAMQEVGQQHAAATGLQKNALSLSLVSQTTSSLKIEPLI